VPFVERPDGTRLYVEVAGDPRRAPIVLVEGLGDAVAGWRRNVPHLATELFAVAYDHRGCGASGPVEGPTTMTTYVEDCLAVMDELRIDRAHMYGRSFGGAAVLELALRNPERIRSAIIGAAHAGTRHVVASSGRSPKAEPWRQRYSATYVEAHPALVREDRSFEGPRNRAGERRQWEALRAWDAFDRLGEVSAPVLVLHGSEDRLIDPDNARLIAERIPHAELVLIEGAGHAYHLEQPDRADAIVLEFVRRHRT
jgi:pimeloyl-ACP methyl ester carboxylesterase